MGELIHVDEFKQFFDAFNRGTRHPPPPRNPTYYFPDCHWDNGQYRFTVESGYPERVGIHWDFWSNEKNRAAVTALKVRIRRWVRDHCAGDVILGDLDLSYEAIGSYWKDFGPNKGHEHSYRSEIEHGYALFSFETAADAVAFRLVFADHCSDIDPRHPSRHYSEKAVALAAAHPHKNYRCDGCYERV